MLQGFRVYSTGEYIFGMGVVEVATRTPETERERVTLIRTLIRTLIGAGLVLSGTTNRAPRRPSEAGAGERLPLASRKDTSIMTDWHTEVDVPYLAGDDPQDVLGAVLRAMPGFATVKHDASRDRLTISHMVEASTLRQACERAIRIVRDAVMAVLEAPTVPNGIRVITEKQLRHEVEHPERVDLVGMVEAGEILGVSRQRVYQLAEDHPDFPQPIAELAAGKIFTRASIEAFDKRWERKRTGRPRKAVFDAGDYDDSPMSPEERREAMAELVIDAAKAAGVMKANTINQFAKAVAPQAAPIAQLIKQLQPSLVQTALARQAIAPILGSYSKIVQPANLLTPSLRSAVLSMNRSVTAQMLEIMRPAVAFDMSAFALRLGELAGDVDEGQVAAVAEITLSDEETVEHLERVTENLPQPKTPAQTAVFLTGLMTLAYAAYLSGAYATGALSLEGLEANGIVYGIVFAAVQLMIKANRM